MEIEQTQGTNEPELTLTHEGAVPKKQLWPPVGPMPHWGVISFLGVFLLLVFGNTLHDTGFTFDSRVIIKSDPRLRDVKAENIRQILREDYSYPHAVSGFYRPLTTLSYLFNYSVLGNRENATGYHWINFLLHWMNSTLVYFVVLILMGNPWPAMLTAALFAVHPVVTDSVSNLIGRAELLAAAAALGSFLCYAKSANQTGGGRVWWLSLAGLIALLGVFCKESAVVVLGVAVLYDFTYRLQSKSPNRLVSLWRNFWSFALKGYIAFVPALWAMTVVRKTILIQVPMPVPTFLDNPLIGCDFWTARLTAIKVIGKYFWLLLWPQTLSCDYSYNQVPLVTWSLGSWENGKALIALATMLAVIFFAIRNFRRNKAGFFFVGLFFVALLPSSNLLPNFTSAHSLFDRARWCDSLLMAERFLYLPSIGYAGCVVVAVYATCRRLFPHVEYYEREHQIWLQFAARGTLILLVAAAGVRTWLRNQDWENNLSLWTHDVQASPGSFNTHKSVAYALYEQLDPSAKDYEPILDRIIEEGEKALGITEQSPVVFLHLGTYYRLKGDRLAQQAADGTLIPSPASQPWYQKSIDTLARAVPLDRSLNDENRRNELCRSRKLDEIADIGNHEIYWNLGISCLRLRKYQEALNAYLYMRHLAPTNPDAYVSIASVLIAAGRAEDAAVSLLQALLLDSSRQDALGALFDIYQQIDKEGCAVIPAEGHSPPKLNADCPLFRDHVCRAYAGLVQTFMEAKQRELARQTSDNALKSYSCPRELFEKALSLTTATVP